MRRLRIPALVLIAMLSAACAQFAKEPPSTVVRPNIPAVPLDVQQCVTDPLDPPDKALGDGETEELWKLDRAALASVNACLHRLICQTVDTRRRIGGVRDRRLEAVCAVRHPGKGAR